jgi:uncharacterized protein
MSLTSRIQEDLKQAMLDRNELTVTTLRLVRAAMSNAEIAKGAPLVDADIVQVIQKEQKKRRESALAYRQVNQEEAALKEDQEALILQPYIPAMATEAEILAVLSDLAPQLPQRGKLIKATLEHFSGTADGSVVARLAASLPDVSL